MPVQVHKLRWNDSHRGAVHEVGYFVNVTIPSVTKFLKIGKNQLKVAQQTPMSVLRHSKICLIAVTISKHGIIFVTLNWPAP